MSLRGILEYPIHPHYHQLFNKLILYRQLLFLYLCPGETYIGGPLVIKYNQENDEAKVDWTETMIETLPQEGYLIKPLIIRFYQGLVNEHNGHASLLIFNIKDQTYEYFDPNGHPSWYYPVLKGISTYIRFYAKGYQSIIYQCPVAPQMREAGEDTCSDWSLLFVYLHCIAPSYYQTIKSEIAEMSPAELRNLITRWRSYLWQLSLIARLPEISYDIFMVERKLSNEPIFLFHLKNEVYRLLAQNQETKAVDLLRRILEPLETEIDRIVRLDLLHERISF